VRPVRGVRIVRLGDNGRLPSVCFQCLYGCPGHWLAQSTGGIPLASADQMRCAVADRIASAYTCAAMEARALMLSRVSSLVRLIGQRDAFHRDRSLLEREDAVLRSLRLGRPRNQRPYYVPEERALNPRWMRLRDWSIEEADRDSSPVPQHERHESEARDSGGWSTVRRCRSA